MKNSFAGIHYELVTKNTNLFSLIEIMNLLICENSYEDETIAKLMDKLIALVDSSERLMHEIENECDNLWDCFVNQNNPKDNNTPERSEISGGSH